MEYYIEMEIAIPEFTDLLDLISNIDRHMDTIMEKQTRNNTLHVNGRMVDKLMRYQEIIFHVISAIWLLHPVKFYDFLRNNSRDPIISKSFYPLHIIMEYELLRGEAIKSPMYSQMIKYLRSVDIENLKRITIQLNDRLLEWLDFFFSEDTLINVGEIIRENKLFWLSTMVCEYSIDFPKNKTGKVLQLARLAYEENDTQSMIAIYSHLAEYLDLPKMDKWYRKDISRLPKIPR